MAGFRMLFAFFSACLLPVVGGQSFDDVLQFITENPTACGDPFGSDYEWLATLEKCPLADCSPRTSLCKTNIADETMARCEELPPDCQDAISRKWPLNGGATTRATTIDSTTQRTTTRRPTTPPQATTATTDRTTTRTTVRPFPTTRATTTQMIFVTRPTTRATGVDVLPVVTTKATDARDWHSWCCKWASEGYCETNPKFTRSVCQKSCGTYNCRIAGEKALSCKVTVALDHCPARFRPSSKKTMSGPITKTSSKAMSTKHFTFRRTTTTTRAIRTASQASGCVDSHDRCERWASANECDHNPFWMRINCQRSCNCCGCTLESIGSTINGGGCTNGAKYCNFWAFRGECVSNRQYMLKNCRKACRVC